MASGIGAGATSLIVVSNSSPLIALQQIGALDLLVSMYGKVLIPVGVAIEIAPTVASQAWLEIVKLKHPGAVKVYEATLDLGESEAICLAKELNCALLLMDELSGRKHALKSGIHVMGTLGVLVEAKRRGKTGNIRPYLDALSKQGFYFSEELYNSILEQVRE